MKTKRPFLSFKDIPIFYHPYALFVFSLLVLGIFFVTNPKFAPLLIPFKREKMVASFIESTKKQGKINAKEFWALREFYSPGSLSIHKEATTSPFLSFTSDKIISSEWLVTGKNQNTILQKNTAGIRTIFRTKNEHIYHDGHTIHVVFLKPLSEMITVNAIYDYKDKDKKFLENKLWYVDTVINTR